MCLASQPTVDEARAVPFVPGDANEAEARLIGDELSESDRLIRAGDAASIHPGIDINQHTQLRAGRSCRPGQRLDVVSAVRSHQQVGRQCRLSDCVDHGRVDDLIDDEDVIEPGRDQNDRLPGCRGAETDHTGIALEASEFRAYAYLHTRTERRRQTPGSPRPSWRHSVAQRASPAEAQRSRARHVQSQWPTHTHRGRGLGSLIEGLPPVINELSHHAL